MSGSRWLRLEWEIRQAQSSAARQAQSSAARQAQIRQVEWEIRQT